MPVNLNNLQQILNVYVGNPDQVMFEGDVEAVTSVNDRGEFDLLPLHENFITLIKNKAIIHYKIGGEKKEFKMDSGVLKIQKNKVYILTGFDTLGEDLTAGTEQKTENISK